MKMIWSNTLFKVATAVTFTMTALIFGPANADLQPGIQFETAERSQPQPILIVGASTQSESIFRDFSGAKTLLAVGDPRLVLPGTGQNRHPFKFYPGNGKDEMPSYQAFEIDYRQHKKIQLTANEFEQVTKVLKAASVRCPVYIYTDLEGAVIQKIKATCKSAE